MGTVLSLKSIEDTRLWQRLETGFSKTKEKTIAADLARIVASACATAVERIKQFPYHHPEFTLHDERHLLRVTELMAIVLDEDIKSLNPIEVALLILSAFYHDQGMVPEADEWKRIQASPQFLLSLERWEQDHSNVRDIRRQFEDPRFNDREKDALSEKLQQHLDAHRTNFLRVTHGERAEQFVHQLYGSGAELSIAGVSLATLLGRLCASHVWPASRLTDENGFRVDQAVGSSTVNLRFLALILRLADILDFDRDRTPESLLRTINISSPVSLLEWSKHRSVEGWEISKKRVRFTLACEHPAYQKAAYEFMDAIDHELREAHRIVDEFPRATPTHYRLNIPRQVERDRIEPMNKLSITISQSASIHCLDSELGFREGRFSYVSALEYVAQARELLSVQSKFQSVNRNHPVVRFVQQYQGLRYRDLTDFQHYCASVVWLLSDDKNLSTLAAGNVEKGRQYRRLGTIFKSIDWSRQDPSLAPPYRVWTSDGGILEITKDDLVRWAGFSKDDQS